VERVQVLFRFKALLEQHAAELSALVTLENGKGIKDATGEVRRGIESVEFACGMPSLLMGETVRDIARGIDNVSYRFPLGVVAAILPFNFPAMIPLWTLPVAIGAGNTYILKPSERTPLSAQLLVQAGLPDGVVNIVHGARDAVNGILAHPEIRAVSFVGSKPAAEYVYRMAATHGKRAQALAGAKNSLIVLPDAALDRTVENVISSPFGNACSIFTESGAAARHFREQVQAGMLGINVGIAGPMAFFPFNGIKGSFFGDLHANGKDGVRFFTEHKVEVVRWFSRPEVPCSVSARTEE